MAFSEQGTQGASQEYKLIEPVLYEAIKLERSQQLLGPVCENLATMMANDPPRCRRTFSRSGHPIARTAQQLVSYLHTGSLGPISGGIPGNPPELDFAIINLYRDTESSPPILSPLTDATTWHKAVMTAEEQEIYDTKNQALQEKVRKYKTVPFDNLDFMQKMEIASARRGPALPQGIIDDAEAKYRGMFWFFIHSLEYPSRRDQAKIMDFFGHNNTFFLSDAYENDPVLMPEQPKGFLGKLFSPSSQTVRLDSRKYIARLDAPKELATQIYMRLFDVPPPQGPVTPFKPLPRVSERPRPPAYNAPPTDEKSATRRAIEKLKWGLDAHVL
jgi:hypothetical protein